MSNHTFRRKMDLLSFRSSITHAVAQNLLIDESFNIDSYLNQWARLLLNGYEYDLDEVSEVIIYARNHAYEEVITIKNMQKRGIQINVKGHGGSAIDPFVLAEIAIAKAN